MKTRYSSDFEDHLIASSKSALVQLIRTLRPYKEAIVLIGGWVPYLLLESHRAPGDNFRHVGPIDIDLIVDPSEKNSLSAFSHSLYYFSRASMNFLSKRALKKL